MVRSAKSAGGGSSLLPRGLDSIQDIPWDLSLAIDHAIRVCSWQENLIGKEMPPQWMWPFEDELELWFERVDAQRKEKYGGGSDDDETSPMMSNEFSERFRRD